MGRLPQLHEHRVDRQGARSATGGAGEVIAIRQPRRRQTRIAHSTSQKAGRERQRARDRLRADRGNQVDNGVKFRNPFDSAPPTTRTTNRLVALRDVADSKKREQDRERAPHAS